MRFAQTISCECIPNATCTIYIQYVLYIHYIHTHIVYLVALLYIYTLSMYLARGKSHYMREYMHVTNTRKVQYFILVCKSKDSFSPNLLCLNPFAFCFAIIINK